MTSRLFDERGVRLVWCRECWEFVPLDRAKRGSRGYRCAEGYGCTHEGIAHPDREAL